jgi:uncharacterized protein (DUF58 family)
MRNRYAAIALSTASLFLIVMAILVNSPPLFYMATAVIATIGGSRLQAYLAVRGLRFERSITPAVQVGEPVTVHITIWSERRLKRPLVMVMDHLPRRLVDRDQILSLPVAPSFDQPIQTKYSFVPRRRGVFRWQRVTVEGTDALGLATLKKVYPTEPTELKVYPAPLPIHAAFSPTAGWGQSELETGRSTGSGLDTRSIREYVTGDALRTIHWKSSAKRGELMVKEFESGSGITLRMILQRTDTIDNTDVDMPVFEAMCGHALYLAHDYLEKGALVHLPQVESAEATLDHPEARQRAVREALTLIQPDQPFAISQEVEEIGSHLQSGETIVIFVAQQDHLLPAVLLGLHDVQKVCFVYDPMEYGAKSDRGMKAASATSFVSQLELAGAQVICAPRVEKLG